jgi:[acyl-carrier-protein] S-malonyltransferase
MERSVKELLALFPGQGSQTVGMGRHLWEGYPSVAELFSQASDVLGYDLRRLCADGPLEELTRTDRAQPAIFVCSAAAWSTLALGGREKPATVLTLGHSLGEYSALVAAGHLGFAEALRVVELRGAAMWECGLRRPGVMMAVLGLEDGRVEEVCARLKGVWPANYNAPGQVVISGETAAVAEAGRLALEAGAKRVVPLQVSGAFHSPLMAEAATELAAALAEVTFRPSAGARFFSTTEVRFPEPDELKDVLVRQLTSPVRFTQSLQEVLPRVSYAVEVGPGSVLAGLARKAGRAPEVWGTGDQSALDATLSRLADAQLVSQEVGA